MPESSVRGILDLELEGDPHKVAVIDGGRTITFDELRARVSALAGGLLEDFTAGDLLAIWLPNGAEILCLYLACLRTGVVPMPLHQGMKWPEVRSVLEHTRVRALVTSRGVADRYADDLSRTSLDRTYLIDAGPSPKLYRVYAEPTGRDDARASRPVPAAGVGLVLHTSGSSGRAKGVMLSHASIRHALHDRRTRAKLTSDSVLVVASCLTQSVGFYQSLALLTAGGTLVLLESYDSDRMVACLHRHQPTHLIMVVDAFDKLLHHPSVTAASFQRLSFACAGADRVTARVQDRFIALTGRPSSVSYGLTESSWALFNSGDRIDKCLALGTAGPGVDVRLRGDGGGEAALGEVGEILIKSPRTMLGYLHDEQLTREAFVDGWLATGDLAYQDVDGYFWFAGRKKSLIVLSSGDNVSPLEVESAILSHPGVSCCTVVGVAPSSGSQVPWAYVTRLDATLSEAHLDAFLRERLSDFKIPRRIAFVAELPLGLTGKVRVGDVSASANVLGGTA